MDSLGSILDNSKPDVVILNEIKTKNRGKIGTFFKKRGFELLVRIEGGIALAVLEKFRIINVTVSNNPCILSGLVQGLNIRLIAAYGPQETLPKEERIEFFDELSTEIQNCSFAGNNPLICGDFNAKLTCEDGNVKAISSNGEILLEVIEDHSLKVMNFSSKCHGYWTRVQKVNGVVIKSVLDYYITNTNLEHKLKSMLIDEQKLICPFRVRKSTNKSDGSGINGYSQVFSDHNALLVSLTISYKEVKREASKKIVRWRITEEGLKEFNKITSHCESRHLSKMTSYSEFEKEVGHVMNTCFKKRKFKPNMDAETDKITDPHLKEVLKLLIPMLKKGNSEKKVAKEYILQLKVMQLETTQKYRQKRLQSSMQSLVVENEFSVDKFWKIRKEVMGGCEERTSVITSNGIELFHDEGIINEYREEFINRLRHRTIHPSYTDYEKQTNEVLETLLANDVLSRPDFTVDEVSKVLKILKKGKAYPDEYPPEIFMYAGKHMVEGITNILNNIKRTMKSPHQWCKMAIKTLYKNKGTRKRLKNHRGIFLTVILSKVMERLLLLRSEEATGNIDKAQCGSQKGKCTADCKFVINSMIDHSLYLNKTLYITSYDYATCFDSLWLEDCLLALLDIGVDTETVNLLYEMNRSAEVTVRTPFGNAPPFTANNFVKQGTVWGSKLCCATTAELSKQDTTGGASVGSVTIQSTLYVDDCNRFNTNINDVILSHHKFLNFSNRKRVPLNGEKCVLLPINKKAHSGIPLLMIGDHVMKEVDKTKVLGDIFNQKGNNNDLIAARVKSGKGVINSMMALCNEMAFGRYSIKALLLLYRTVFIHTVLFDSEAWTYVTETNMKMLRIIQLKCLKRIVRTSTGTPNSFLLLEMGVLPMEAEIHVRKLRFLHHIVTLKKDDPVWKVYVQQQQYPYARNWANSIKEIKGMYNLPSDEEIENMSRESWKKMVKTSVSKRAMDMLIDECKKQSKTRHLQYEENSSSFQPQEYLSIYPAEDAIVILKLRSRSVNCLNNRGDKGLCRICGGAAETQQHAINCWRIAQDRQPLLLGKVYGEVKQDDKIVVEIVRRYRLFEKNLNKCPQVSG